MLARFREAARAAAGCGRDLGQRVLSSASLCTVPDAAWAKSLYAQTC